MPTQDEIKCPCCGRMTHVDDMAKWDGEDICDDCAQNTADFDYYDDPHNKKWGENLDH